MLNFQTYIFIYLCFYFLDNGNYNITQTYYCVSVLMGPCHHGMARPQVADIGTASDK